MNTTVFSNYIGVISYNYGENGKEIANYCSWFRVGIFGFFCTRSRLENIRRHSVYEDIVARSNIVAKFKLLRHFHERGIPCELNMLYGSIVPKNARELQTDKQPVTESFLKYQAAASARQQVCLNP